MRGDGGQASLEVLAVVPLLAAIALMAVYLAGLLGAVASAQDRARDRAMAAQGRSGGVVTVTGSSAAPALPGIPGATVRQSAAVRAP
jgi:hypothetical protein